MSKETKKKREKPAHGSLSNDLFLLRLTWKYIPGYVIWEMIYGVIWGFQRSTWVLITKLFFDALEAAWPFWHVVLLILGFLAYYAAFQAWYQWYRNVYRLTRQQTLHYELNKLLFEKAKTLDLACYDDTEYYNEFVFAMNQSDSRAVGLIESISGLISTAVTISLIAAVLSSISPLLAIIAVGAGIIEVVCRRFAMKIQVKADVELNKVNRRGGYYERIFNTPDLAKEVRISHVDEVALDKYAENLDTVRKTQVKYNRKLFLARLPRSILNWVSVPLVYAILLYGIMVTKTASLASLAVTSAAFFNFKYQLTEIIDSVIKFPEHGLYIEKMRTFLEYEPKVRSGPLPAPEFESLTLRNVSFGYNAEKTVLKGVNMTLLRGEKIAIVGYNGAGKSTLVKLFMHLYDPTDGEMLLNGRDIGEYDTPSYQDRIGVVFQDFQIFALPVAENVICESYDESKRETVERAVRLSTFDEKVASLEGGIRTELTREFYEDGVNLSGGENQKVAIARVFAHPYDLIIMDEPSSALDPVAEYELNRHISEFAEDKTVVFISHRLSTTRHVDRIYMFDDGSLIEEGSHDELMKKDGKYAEMFRMQAEKYGRKE